MNSITTESTVAEIVRAVPSRSRVFENLGIDYCCGGKKPLAEACQAKGLDPATVLAMLAASDEMRDSVAVDPDTLSLSELCDHIEQSHHAYLAEALPRLDFMTRKVAAVHGDHEPRLLELRRVFEAMHPKMVAHTKEEEDTVFPAIRELDSATKKQAATTAGLGAALSKLETEHDGTGEALARFKELTDSYTPPEWACNTFRALYDLLAELESNTHQHVHKENNVLFPKVLSSLEEESPEPSSPVCYANEFKDW